MYLSALKLQGFKSFADRTTLQFGPGVTVVVGPNGSGKSNIVDALTWVLGTLSPRSVRGGAMADVIFAGSPSRPAYGRAAVEIKIDNSDGSLPVEFAEVTIGRAMFASGENEYTINGETCRQLDIAELLNDSGLGRQGHTIVGQGQLDTILAARAEDRRTFIDEAAGIVKHRRRKERALRKLTQVEEHAARVREVRRELQRNLRPLERQAEAATTHAELTAALRSVRITRLTRELDRWSREHEAYASRARDDEAEIARVRAQLGNRRSHEQEQHRALDALRPRVEEAAATHFQLAGLLERFRGLQNQIIERRRGLQTALNAPAASDDPARLHASAAAERERLAEVEQDRTRCRSEVDEAASNRASAEQARRAHDQAAAAEARRRAAARERRLRLEGEVSALRSALAQAASEEGRLGGRLASLHSRQEKLVRELEDVEREIAQLRQAHEQESEADRACAQELERRTAELDEVIDGERDFERQQAVIQARAEALQATMADLAEGAQTLLDAGRHGAIGGLLGPLADHIQIRPGTERAIAAALGPLGDALVVRSPEDASAAIGFVRDREAGRVLLLVGRTDKGMGLTSPGIEGAQPLVDVLDGDPAVIGALSYALAGVYLTPEYDSACALADRHPACTFVALDGHVAGAHGYAGGGMLPATGVERRAALDQTIEALKALEAQEPQLQRERDAALASREAAEQRRREAADDLRASEGRVAAALERRDRLRTEIAQCTRELETVNDGARQLGAEVEDRRARLADLERSGEPEDDQGSEGPDLEAEQLEDELKSARTREMEAYRALSATETRYEEIARRVADLERQATAAEDARVAAERRRQRRLEALARCDVLAEVAATALSACDDAVEVSARERGALEQERDERQRALGAVRTRISELEGQLADHAQAQHTQQLAQAKVEHALEAAKARAFELGLDPGKALADARKDPEAMLGGGEERDLELAEEEERLSRRLALLGPVNPLAVEEFNALTERHRFLSEQLDDLDRSRRDLLEVVDKVEHRIREVFASAFADVAEQFSRLFPRLFPGGEGALLLTDPDDLLNTGVDVEARPPGKRVKRLSLLSGGERSLVALAVLFAIFAARPSPFYVLDEVEAALDDVNLQRVLEVMADFRASSQLIVVTHQKRTMEIADVLYGVTMRSGGVSKVLSQRLSDVA